jgi:hypothetical protein
MDNVSNMKDVWPGLGEAVIEDIKARAVRE